MKAPNTFIIGAPKSGTSSLCHYLSEHPMVFLSRPKELFFWSEDHAAARARCDVHSLESYLEFFRDANEQKHTVVAEGSTNYLQSHVAAKNILRFNSASRFILVLRDPVEVVQALHGELRRHFFEDVADFQTAWRLQEQRAKGDCIPANCVMRHQLLYDDVVNYAGQLERLFDVTAPEQRKVFLFEDLKSDAKRVYLDCLEFLGIPDDGRASFPLINVSRQYRFERLARSYQSPPKGLEPIARRLRLLYARLPNTIRRCTRVLTSTRNVRAPLPLGFEMELRARFSAGISRLEMLLDRDLGHWKQVSR